jgi:NAD(P)-dependent dehydrogenase (short-subunit alcohol dehydrogenase family)
MSTPTCVVTGGARGIGRAIAELMVARGYGVVVTDLDGRGAAETAAQIGGIRGLVHDVRDPQAHREVAWIAAGLGPLQVWFNNAGVAFDADLGELSDEQVATTVGVNLLGVMYGTRAAMATFGPAGGDIVNTASLSAHGPVPGLSAYAATKAAVLSLTMSVSLEAPRGVRVHALCPDGVATAMVGGMQGGTGEKLVRSGGALLAPEEVARAAVALVGSRRVVRTIPGWRAAALRAGTLLPSQNAGVMRLFERQGARALDRR